MANASDLAYWDLKMQNIETRMLSAGWRTDAMGRRPLSPWEQEACAVEKRQEPPRGKRPAPSGPLVGDEKREAVIDQLSQAFADGYLTRPEFDRRIAKAWKRPLRQSQLTPILEGLPGAQDATSYTMREFDLAKDLKAQRLQAAKHEREAVVWCAIAGVQALTMVLLLLGGIYLW